MLKKMKVTLTMLLLLQSYQQLCSQARAFLVSLPNLSMKLSSSFHSAGARVLRSHARLDNKQSRRIFLSLSRGGYTKDSHVEHTSLSESLTFGGASALDYSTITGKLKLAKFGDRSYLSTEDVVASNQHRVVFILGGPGSGKGTQCDRIVTHYKCIHLSAGDLLRQERARNGKYAQAIEEAIVAGNIVPVEITLGLLADAMNQKAADPEYGAAIFLIDGFPRNFDNLDGWTRLMKDKTCILGLLVINCPVEELERRILSRGATSGRSDDNLASARKRFATFETHTMPVIRTLHETDFSVGQIDIQIAGDRPEEDVWKDTKSVMDRLVLNDVLTANQKLLDAISQNNWATYSHLVDPIMLWPAEKNSGQHNVTESELKRSFLNLEYIRGHNVSEQEVNILSNVEAEIMGISAVVSYKRSILKADNGEIISRIHETRVWLHTKQGWLNVHFVRRPIE